LLSRKGTTVERDMSAFRMGVDLKHTAKDARPLMQDYVSSCAGDLFVGMSFVKQLILDSRSRYASVCVLKEKRGIT
jgi:hypothetical protein